MFQKYLYESRHRHAMNRVRGNGGIFVGNGEEKPEQKVNMFDGAGTMLSSMSQ